MTSGQLERHNRTAIDLLCLLARPTPDLARAAEILRQGVDFPVLLTLASVHGVRPQLFRGLADLDWQGVPDDVRADLESIHRFHCARSLALSEELGRIASTFAARGVVFAAFKGAPLATALYGDLAWREYNDIDLLVPEPQIGEAEAVLDTLGYRCDQGDRPFRQAFLAYQRQYQFRNVGTGATVDLHWDLCGIHVPFPLTPAEIWACLDRVSVGGHVVPTVSGGELALLLAGHGTKETWSCLEWVNDFAMLIERRPDLDWPAIHRRAKARGCGEAVLLACAMAQRLLDVRVPEGLVALVDSSSRVDARATALVALLHDGLSAPEGKEHLADIDLCDGRWARTRAMLHLAFTRTAGDYHALPLPRGLWRVYHVTRPFRLLAKAFAARMFAETSPRE